MTRGRARHWLLRADEIVHILGEERKKGGFGGKQFGVLKPVELGIKWDRIRYGNPNEGDLAD